MFRSTQFTCLHFIVLLISFLGIQRGYAQVTIPPDGITVESGMNIAQNGYEVGKLSVQANYTSGVANVTITLPDGITMKPNSLVKDSGTGTIANINITGSVVTFDIQGASGALKFSLDKLISPAAHRSLVTGGVSGFVLEDTVKIVQGGTTVQEKSKTYSYLYPVLNVVNADANNTAVRGVNTSTFEILSSGDGNAFDIYFTVNYPTGITHNEISYNGSVLAPINQNGSKYTFKIDRTAHSSGNGLPNSGTLLITHKYNVTERCVNGLQIQYLVNWGRGNAETDWYQVSDNTAERTVSSSEGQALLEITRRGTIPNEANGQQTDFTKTYFTLKGGLCVPVGGVMGTMRVSYTNYGGNTSLASAIYNLTLYLLEENHSRESAFYYPTNFRIISASGETPVPIESVAVSGYTGDKKVYRVNFASLTANPDGAGGIEDLDNDGKFNDLASGANLVVEYDLVKNKDISNTCANPNYNLNSLNIGPYSAYGTYDNMCGVKVKGTNPNDIFRDAVLLRNNSFIRNFAGISDAAYTPATLYRGATPIESRFLFGSTGFNTNQIISSTTNTGNNTRQFRLQYKVKLPTGVKATNIKWVTSDSYPGTNPSINPDASSVLTGQDLVITAPVNNARGYITMDLEADCPTNSGSFSGNIEYEIIQLDNYDRPELCPLKILCASKPITVICGSDCGSDGPIMLATSAERAANSYGWKTDTMEERHTRATMPPFLLKRALYLDDVEVTAKGRQEKGIANNLYYSFTTNKGVSLAPKQIVVKFTSGTRSGTSETLSSSVANVTTTGAGVTLQKRILWNLTSALKGTPLAEQDTFEVVATYQVDVNNEGGDFVNQGEIVVADKSYFFMYATNGTTELYCGNTSSPEFYITNSYIQKNGLNGYIISGCTTKDIGGYIVHLARRFSSSGTVFQKEFRPDRLIKTFSFTIPKSYSVQSIRYEYSGLRSDGVITIKPITLTLNDFVRTESGNNIIYTIENTYNPTTKSYKLPPGILRVTTGYSAFIRVDIQASCSAKTDRTEYIDTSTELYDYFYHYGLTTPYGTAHSGTPTAAESTHQVVQYNNKPVITLSSAGNTVFSVATAEQEIKVKLTNTSSNEAAPYTWLSIPDVTGIEVLGVYSGTTQIAKVATITGESMYHLSTAGLAIGKSQEYSVRVRLTNCSTATLKMYSGWNCNSFPAGYNQTCSSATDNTLLPSEASFTLNYSGSEVQLSRISTPNPDPADPSRAKLHMCEDNWYEYEINSAKPGDILDPQISIAKEVGITIAAVEIYYPHNATTPSVVTGVDNGGAMVFNLLPAGQILPGTASSPGQTNRKVRVRINVKPDCNFRGGSTFGLEVIGKNSCGGPLEGARDNAITAGVDGANSLNYSVQNTLTYVSGDANNCSAGAVYEGEHKIVANPGNSNGANGKVVLHIPQGFDIVAGSFTVAGQSGTFSSTVELETPNGIALPSGEKEYRIRIPDGMYNADWFKYRITVKQPDGQISASCTAIHKISYYTIDVVTTVNCPGVGICSNMTTITAPAKSVDITANRAVLEIRNLAVTSEAKNGKEELSYTFNIENTSSTAYNGVLKISLYDDVNNNGQVDNTGDVLIDTITLPSQNFAGNSTVSGLNGKIELDQSNVCRLLMKIKASDNNCLCDTNDVIAPAPNPISGLMADVTVCQTEEKQLEYNANAPTYVSYRWTSTNATAMNYLSANNISNPTFKYTGANLTSATTFVYSLTVRRTDGCESSQQVNITVTPAPAGPAATPQTFCGNATVQDLSPNTNVVWYSTATSETPLSPAQAIFTGVYYVASTSGTCESLRTAVNVTVNPIPVAPTATAQTLCEGATVQNLLPNGTNVVWYNVPTGGTALSPSEVLTTRKYYVASSSANCESSRTEVDVTITSIGTPIATVTHPTCTVATGSVELTGLPSGNWTINYIGGNVAGTGTSYTIPALAPGTYTFTVTNAAGCTSPYVSAYISTPPVVSPDPTYRVINPVCGTTTGTVIFEGLSATDFTASAKASHAA
ncbi:MAG: hypothetical protein Q4C98_06075, partial [Capnocytophaga sp.]|nr:hypothetical protein [Capnocytophaga sp.]